jgi:outer membrane protein OmpA-like peptidoglycan-associated protein
VNGRQFQVAPLVIALLAPTMIVMLWVSSAKARLEEAARAPDKQEVAVAAASDAGYCNADLKKILRRVLQSCGLLGRDGARGCQPLEAKTLATVSGEDFNALFEPMRERGGIVQFDTAKSDLDEQDKRLLEKTFVDQKGASYFFVVARSSPEGSVTYNRELSKARANAVLDHLQTRFQDPDLEKEVGLLWLGEEFAQLEDRYCGWQRSGDAQTCTANDINRGAFVAWIDCRL